MAPDQTRRIRVTTVAAPDPRPESLGWRDVSLPGGARLVVRPTRAADVDALAAFYDALPAADLYHRFFTVSRPGRVFLERWANIGRDGGAGLVVEACDHPAPNCGPRLVAEAGFAPLANGNGELGICVTPGWRGWLGAYLLDVLVQLAAQQGVPYLEADVLWDNGPMVALGTARRCTWIDQLGPSPRRMRIATDRDPPPSTV